MIDLRSNGGGLLDEAVEIANYFLPRGKVIVTTKGKIKQASNTYKTLREPLDLDIPIAVLVNSGTASASKFYQVLCRISTVPLLLVTVPSEKDWYRFPALCLMAER